MANPLALFSSNMKNFTAPAMQGITSAMGTGMASNVTANLADPAAQATANVAANAGLEGGLNLEKLLKIAEVGNGLWQTLQAGKQMSFQNNLAKQAFGMQKEIHEENKADREARRNVDFTAGLVS